MSFGQSWGSGYRCLLVGRRLRQELEAAFRQAGLSVVAAASDREAILTLEREPVTLVIIDGGTGAAAAGRVIARAGRCHPAVPSVILGETSTVEEGVAAMKAGAADYLPPPLDPAIVLAHVRPLVESRRTAEAKTAAATPGSFMGLVGGSESMSALFATIEKVSRYKANVLILGESGTGKELIARALHARGPRRKNVFVPLNCATLGRELLESELFGHERGAFTGAIERKRGLFEHADGGTLFLDEIGEMDLGLQAKLLRVLERHEFRRVGGTDKVKVDLSLVAASNRDLEAAIQAGRFRADLFYRLKVVTIVVPPLRERREDIPALIDSFIADFNHRNNGKIRGISPSALTRYMQHDWPGNVRELRNAIESAAVLSSGDTIGDDGPIPGARLRASPEGQRLSLPAGIEIPFDSRLEDVERLIIETQLRRSASREATAQVLGIGVRTLYAKLRKYRVAPAK